MIFPSGLFLFFPFIHYLCHTFLLLSSCHSVYASFFFLHDLLFPYLITILLSPPLHHFFFHPVFPSLTLVSYHPNFFFILNFIFLLSFFHLQWLIFPSLFLTHPSSWLCLYFFLLAVSIFVIWLFLCSRWLEIIWEVGRTKTVLSLDLGN